MKFNLNSITPSIPSGGFTKGDYTMVVEEVNEFKDSGAGNPQVQVKLRLKGNVAYDNRICWDIVTIVPLAEGDKATAILVNDLLALGVELPELDGKDMQAIQRKLRNYVLENVLVGHTVTAFLDQEKAEDGGEWLKVLIYRAPKAA